MSKSRNVQNCHKQTKRVPGHSEFTVTKLKALRSLQKKKYIREMDGLSRGSRGRDRSSRGRSRIKCQWEGKILQVGRNTCAKGWKLETVWSRNISVSASPCNGQMRKRTIPFLSPSITQSLNKHVISSYFVSCRYCLFLCGV